MLSLRVDDMRHAVYQASSARHNGFLIPRIRQPWHTEYCHVKLVNSCLVTKISYHTPTCLLICILSCRFHYVPFYPPYPPEAEEANRPFKTEQSREIKIAECTSLFCEACTKVITVLQVKKFPAIIYKPFFYAAFQIICVFFGLWRSEVRRQEVRGRLSDF